MRPALPRLRAGLVLALALALGGASPVATAPVAVAADDAPWLPLEPGSRFLLRTHRDLSVEREGRATQRRFLHGRIERALARDETRQGRVIVRERNTEWDAERSMPGQADLHSAQSEVLAREERGVVLVRQEREPSEGGIADYAPPLLWLPANAAPGVTWKVGVERRNELEIALEARVRGIEDVTTDAGPFRGCLVVQFDGALRGSATLDERQFPVEGGRSSVKLWIARGVGIVREERELKMDMRDPSGKSVRLAQTQRAVLVSSSPAPSTR